ncbi:MAG: shikimate kinase, partial [Bacteroidota bacterium]
RKRHFSPMKFILILGAPAVGKRAVGEALSQRAGIPLFHNHQSIKLVLPYFYYDSPGFSRLNRLIRFGIFEEVAKSDLPGLIFTLV